LQVWVNKSSASCPRISAVRPAMLAPFLKTGCGLLHGKIIFRTVPDRKEPGKEVQGLPEAVLTAYIAVLPQVCSEEVARLKIAPPKSCRLPPPTHVGGGA
jgi:hypothetical protein